jgi:hypothetical protein
MFLCFSAILLFRLPLSPLYRLNTTTWFHCAGARACAGTACSTWRVAQQRLRSQHAACSALSLLLACWRLLRACSHKQRQTSDVVVVMVTNRTPDVGEQRA